MAVEQGPVLSCPNPIPGGHVSLAHGGGGRMMRQIIRDLFLAHLGPNPTGPAHDGAIVTPGPTPYGLAFTTDSFVVDPLFFPGGDIGSMAVHGTVNDLAMCGARPICLSAGFILEEGLDLDVLRRVVASMARAAAECGIAVVTGDTKVVDRGKGDGVFINTSGLGAIVTRSAPHPCSVAVGDHILVSGDLARHGIAVMSVREGLAFESPIESDSACVGPLVLDLIEAGVDLHCLRDLTRGGLASALNEIALDAQVSMEILEGAIPVSELVRGACEVLGLDPLYVANEGRFLAFVPAHQSEAALAVMRTHPLGHDARVIGEVHHGGSSPSVTLTTRIGSRRALDLLTGEQLPRIC